MQVHNGNSRRNHVTGVNVEALEKLFVLLHDCPWGKRNHDISSLPVGPFVRTEHLIGHLSGVHVKGNTLLQLPSDESFPVSRLAGQTFYREEANSARFVGDKDPELQTQTKN